MRFKVVQIFNDMKKFTILAAFMLFATVGMFAQSADTTVFINNHEIKINDNEDEISIKIYELNKGKRVSNDPLYESNYFRKQSNNGRRRVFTYATKDEEFVREETNTTVVKTKSRWFNHDLKNPFPHLYFAHLEMTDGSFGTFAQIHQRSSSFEWGMYSPTTIFCTKDGHFGMATALGFSNSYNFFNHDYVMAMQDGDATMMTLSDYTEGQHTSTGKSFLRYWSLRIPLSMQLQFNVCRSPLTFSAGAELEWRFWVRSFARYDGAKHKISDDLDYNAIGLNALFQVGYNGIIVFTRMGLTEMFNSHNLKDIYQLSVGIGFNFD